MTKNKDVVGPAFETSLNQQRDTGAGRHVVGGPKMDIGHARMLAIEDSNRIEIAGGYIQRGIEDAFPAQFDTVRTDDKWTAYPVDTGRQEHDAPSGATGSKRVD